MFLKQRLKCKKCCVVLCILIRLSKRDKTIYTSDTRTTMPDSHTLKKISQNGIAQIMGVNQSSINHSASLSPKASAEICRT